VIDGHPDIRDTTRSRVELAMAQLRSTRNSFARALATNQSRRAHGYHVRVTTVADDPECAPDAALE